MSFLVSCGSHRTTTIIKSSPNKITKVAKRTPEPLEIQKVEGADAVLAMFHDQGLPVLKNIGFGHSVNITLGLPIIRTSVDHGTALDLAGTGKASSGSMVAAINNAILMIKKRNN